jgi:3-dehydroquinate synthase
MSNLYEKNSVYFGEIAFKKLNEFALKNEFSLAIVLVDTNTLEYCLPYLKSRLSFDFKTICIEAGEEFKNIHTCLEVWESLSKLGADRNSLLINLGGGVISDTGGFVASCYKRGISFIHIPTSLLGMVDASIGGKNGVDMDNLKNQIGVIRPPEMIIIDPVFLKTLPTQQIISGYAEIIKHGLIHYESETYFYDCISLNKFNAKSVSALIDESVSLKLLIVEKDTNEKGLRKALNYGHTLGHAIESYRMTLDRSQHLLHGEAIAIGLILETYISHKLYSFPKNKLEELINFIKIIYPSPYFVKAEQDKIIDFMKHDKKNVKGNINFVLLKDLGEPLLDIRVENELIYDAFDFYHQSLNK